MAIKCSQATCDLVDDLADPYKGYLSFINEQHRFGQPINNFGQIQRHIAESYAEYMAGRSYVYSCAYGLDLESTGNRMDSDGVKLYCSTMGKNVADRAIQSLGGLALLFLLGMSEP